MTNDELNRLCAERMGLGNQWVLMKRGLYYRPEAKGYTAKVEEAWRLTEEQADKHVYPHDTPVTKHPAPIPNYAGDHNAAHSLLDWLRANGWGISVFMEPDDTQCGVRLHRGRTIVEVGESFRVAVATAFLEATK